MLFAVYVFAQLDVNLIITVLSITGEFIFCYCQAPYHEGSNSTALFVCVYACKYALMHMRLLVILLQETK